MAPAFAGTFPHRHAATTRPVGHIHRKRADCDNDHFYLGPESKNGCNRNDDPNRIDRHFVLAHFGKKARGWHLSVACHCLNQTRNGGQIGQNAGKNGNRYEEQRPHNDIVGEIAPDDVEQRSRVMAGHISPMERRG